MALRLSSILNFDGLIVFIATGSRACFLSALGRRLDKTGFLSCLLSLIKSRITLHLRSLTTRANMGIDTSLIHSIRLSGVKIISTF